MPRPTRNRPLKGCTIAHAADSTPSSTSGLDHSINKGQTDEAYDDKYPFQVDITVINIDAPFPVEFIPGQVRMGIYTNDGGGWVKRATIAKNGVSGSSDTFSNVTHPVVVDGLGLNDDFGINIDFELFAGGSLNFDQVTDETATAPTDATATPGGSTPITFIVLGGNTIV